MRFDPVECGKRMKALRESKNLTQMQLAEQLNISLNHVKALEHARGLFSIDLVIEISAFFDVSLDYLLLGKTQSTSKAASELNAAIEILERIKKELQQGSLRGNQRLPAREFRREKFCGIIHSQPGHSPDRAKPQTGSRTLKTEYHSSGQNNETSVTRGPATKKAGWLKRQ